MNYSSIDQYNLLTEGLFTRTLHLERKRIERSRRLLLLILLDIEFLWHEDRQEEFVWKIASSLLPSVRETDVVGWYKTNSTIGVIATEINESYKTSIKEIMLGKVWKALSNNLNIDQAKKIKISFHLFPEDSDKQRSIPWPDPRLYPDLEDETAAKRLPLLMKRAIDITGASLALIILLPLFVIIAALIKVSSRGPVLFRQERIGQLGRRFAFLKFRSMHINCDNDIHKKYVTGLIAGAVDTGPQTSGSTEGGIRRGGIYKITVDPRVTRIGKFLRKTSLDELPQFWNVVRGEMSLVGPRPPIPYEVEAYAIWHRRRLLETKPGITGLWQVTGRSRTTFDDMVRLDLMYVRRWSLWLDVKILLRTPRAVVTGAGAY